MLLVTSLTYPSLFLSIWYIRVGFSFIHLKGLESKLKFMILCNQFVIFHDLSMILHVSILSMPTLFDLVFLNIIMYIVAQLHDSQVTSFKNIGALYDLILSREIKFTKMKLVGTTDKESDMYLGMPLNFKWISIQ